MGDGGIRDLQTSLEKVNAASALAGKVVGDGGVGDPYQEIVGAAEDAAAEIAARVVGDGGVGDSQAGALGADPTQSRVVGDGGVDDGQLAKVGDPAARAVYDRGVLDRQVAT